MLKLLISVCAKVTWTYHTSKSCWNCVLHLCTLTLFQTWMKPENPVHSRFKVNIVDCPSMTESSTAGWKYIKITDLWGLQKGADSAAGLLFCPPSEQREHQAAGCSCSNCDEWSLRGPDDSSGSQLISTWSDSLTCSWIRMRAQQLSPSFIPNQVKLIHTDFCFFRSQNLLQCLDQRVSCFGAWQPCWFVLFLQIPTLHRSN